MEVLENKTDQELLQSMLAETAKALNEVNCARKDLDKARNRLTFKIAVINEMINREDD
jgi:septal ring factor EnvC (AmiA/AmiB activator)